MMILRVHHRLWLTATILILIALATLISQRIRNLPSTASQQVLMLRRDADEKRAAYGSARDEFDEQYAAAVNGEWDNPIKMAEINAEFENRRNKVSELQGSADEAWQKSYDADGR